MSPSKQPIKTLFLIASIVLLSLACSISIDTGQDSANQGPVIENVPPSPTPMSEPVIEQPPAEQPPAEQPTAEQPPAEQPPTEPPPAEEAPPQPDITFEGISFSFDDSLAANVSASVVPADISSDVPEWSSPETIRFDFNNYILANTFHQPQISVYAVAEYEAVNPNAHAIIVDLQNLLAARPEGGKAPMPFLPTWNAGQLFLARIHYLDFQNGSGVAYLTQYGQSYSNINNENLFYTFQGITADGRNYISAILPVRHGSLKETYEIDDFESFANNYDTYIVEMKEALDAEEPSSFTPDLDLLDAMVRSLFVNR